MNALDKSQVTDNLHAQSYAMDWAQRVLGSLDDQTRLILRRYYGYGQTVEQINAELQIPMLKISAAIAQAKHLTARALKSKAGSRSALFNAA